MRLPAQGRLPVELDGLFTQIGPNPIKPPKHTDTARYQWFAQDGMVSGVRIRDGRAQWFRNRWIRSTRVTRTLHVPRTPGPRHFPIDTVHTNVVGHGGMLFGPGGDRLLTGAAGRRTANRAVHRPGWCAATGFGGAPEAGPPHR